MSIYDCTVKCLVAKSQQQLKKYIRQRIKDEFTDQLQLSTEVGSINKIVKDKGCVLNIDILFNNSLLTKQLIGNFFIMENKISKELYRIAKIIISSYYRVPVMFEKKLADFYIINYFHKTDIMDEIKYKYYIKDAFEQITKDLDIILSKLVNSFIIDFKKQISYTDDIIYIKQFNEEINKLNNILSIKPIENKIDAIIHLVHSGGGNVINHIQDVYENVNYHNAIDVIYVKAVSNIHYLFKYSSMPLSLLYKMYYYVHHESKQYLDEHDNLYLDFYKNAKNDDQKYYFEQNYIINNENIDRKYITKQFVDLLIKNSYSDNYELLLDIYQQHKIDYVKEKLLELIPQHIDKINRYQYIKNKIKKLLNYKF